jgi:hypothetical protein
MWIVLTLCLFLAVSLTAGAHSRARAAENPIPLLAYYYIWFDHNSWNRAKTDYPLLGRYSSDDREIMQQHIRWAKDAGIDGFIVSWKSTDQLNARLEQLIEVAQAEDFKLVMIYQGLDFERDPLPIAKVSQDLQFFAEHYALSPVFSLFEKPAVIWSGTWKFTTEEITAVSSAVREQLLVLASERNTDGYQRLAAYVDGNAYYWSSVNPDTYPDYQGKLDGMSQAIHANGGIWIAPAAPGFDARLIGGTRLVERKDGGTLLRQLQTAYQSAPDAVGLISWNEFSENSHIEPSENYGVRYLEVVADFTQSPALLISGFSSDEPLVTEPSQDQSQEFPAASAGGSSLLAIVVLMGLVLISLGVIVVRNLIYKK